MGAVVGSLVISVFGLQPPWAWGMLGGVAGGGAASLIGWVAARPWPPAARLGLGLLIAVAVLTGLFLLAGGRWITDPRNFDVRPLGG